MIKKLLAVLGLSLIPLSFTGATFSSHGNGVFTPSMFDSSYSLTVFKFGEVYTEHGSEENFIFAPNNDLLFYRNQDSKPFLILPSSLGTQYGGELANYYFCDPISSSFTGLSNCSSPQIIDYDYLGYFMSKVSDNDNWAYEVRFGSNVRYGFDLCFSSVSEGKSLCFGVQSSAYNGFHDIFQSNGSGNPLVGSSAFSGDHRMVYTYTFSNIPDSVIGFSPYQETNHNVPIPSSTGLDSYTYVEIGSGDYIDYFEDQEYFSEDLCYIGTKDLNSNYEDRIPYYQGTGYTIFDAFSNLFNTNNLSLNKVGMFLNMVYANYRSWFLGYNRDQNGNVIYNMIYSGGSIELDYGPGLTNPFLNNKAYLYFIGSTVLQTPNIDVYVAGQDVALYCYYKLNDFSNDGETFTINDDYDHKGLDQRVAVNTKYNRTQKTFYTGANEIIGKSREGTPLEYFQQGSGFIDPSDFFNENFNKFKEVLTPLSPGDLGLGYVPGYIIMFMCALILFRFLGH